MDVTTSYHFDLGNSNTGPLGLCAMVTARTPEAALQALRLALSTTNEVAIPFRSGCGVEYVRVYITPDNIGLTDIDDEEDVGEEEEEEEDAPLQHNYYECYSCGHKWEDEYNGQPDDDCDKCGARHCTPYKSKLVK